MDLILKTERLLLRPHRKNDAPALEALADNWNVARMLGRMPHPYPPGSSLTWMAKHDEQRKARTHFEFAIFLGDTLIGGAGLAKRDSDSEAYELGYWLGEPYWGMGYATEAAGAVVRFGFETLGLPQLVSGHFTDNPASGRVLQKLGFRYSGVVKRHCLARGQEVDMRVMTLSRAEWNER